MGNKYSILIEAKIDEVTSKTLIQKNLDAISANITFKIQSFDASAAIVALKTQIQNGLGNITVGIAGGAGSTGGTSSIIGGGPTIPTGGGGIGVDTTTRIAEIQRVVLGSGGTANLTASVNAMGQITNAVVKYQNATKDAITETFGLKKGIDGLVSTGTKFNDSMSSSAASIKKQISDAERLISTTESITSGKSGKVVTDATNSLKNWWVQNKILLWSIDKMALL